MPAHASALNAQSPLAGVGFVCAHNVGAIPFPSTLTVRMCEDCGPLIYLMYVLESNEGEQFDFASTVWVEQHLFWSLTNEGECSERQCIALTFRAIIKECVDYVWQSLLGVMLLCILADCIQTQSRA